MLRVCDIAKVMVSSLAASGAEPWKTQAQTLSAAAALAARLAKTDLLTDMVGEFPELQGIMGQYYALHDGHDALVAQAIADHYKPRFAGDDLPRSNVGWVVAMADKMETLVGMFGIGNLPTGDKDPFALRRHALGVTRILLDKELPIGIQQLIALTQSVFTDKALPSFDTHKLEQFFQERLTGLLESQGYPLSHIHAVLEAQDLQDWSQLRQRLQAVSTFSALPESQALASANKRISNILKKSQEPVDAVVDTALLKESAERELHTQLQAISAQAHHLYVQQDYTGSLQALAGLRQAVDGFFNDVMVNAEDDALRRNRLGLLKQLHSHMNRVADLSRLAQ